MNPVADAAFKRAVVGGLLVAIATFFPLLLQTDDWRMLVSIPGSAFVGVLISRGGFEGWYDVQRATGGNLNKGDVAAASPKLEVVSKETGQVIG